MFYNKEEWLLYSYETGLTSEELLELEQRTFPVDDNEDCNQRDGVVERNVCNRMLIDRYNE
jgi:hypothetical protein